MVKKYKLLIAIPAYNESSRLPKYLQELAFNVQKMLPNARILVVDDGSSLPEQEHLISFIKKLQLSYPCLLNPVLLGKNRGKGGAILAAWDLSNDYSYLAFVDADGAVPVTEVIRLANILINGSDKHAIIGSRIRMMGKTIVRSWPRHLSGRIFSFLVGAMIEPQVYDSQCGLKFITTEAFKKIRKYLNGRKFAFDVEFIAAVRAADLNIEEVPIDWTDIPGSKVSLVRDTFKMSISILEIRKQKKLWTLLNENN